MSKHLTVEEMQRYLVRRLSVDELGTIGEHLHGCRSCYQSYLSVLQTRFPIEIDFDELGGLKDRHLEGEELGDYLAGRMDEVDFDYARLHLEECADCEERVFDSFSELREDVYDTEPTRERHRPTSREYLPFFSANQPLYWRVSLTLLLVAGFALLIWAILPAAPRSQVAKDSPSESIPSQNVPVPSAPATPDPINPSTHRSDQVTPDSGRVGRKDHQVENRQQVSHSESALLAKNLTMPPAIEALDRTPSIAVRGSQGSVESFKVMTPFATVVSNDRPTFSWTALDGAASYKVSVFDADLRLITTSEPLNDTKWTIPSRLNAGVIYTWTVTALKDDHEVVAPAAPARAEFKILHNSERAELIRLLGKTRSHVARGLMYTQTGLLDEAEKEFQTHLGLRPADERVRRWLRILRSWRVVG